MIRKRRWERVEEEEKELNDDYRWKDLEEKHWKGCKDDVNKINGLCNVVGVWKKKVGKSQSYWERWYNTQSVWEKEKEWACKQTCAWEREIKMVVTW